MARLSVKLGTILTSPTKTELFPAVAEVFAPDVLPMADRVCPVVSFDLALANRAWQGRGVFLFTEDPAPRFLTWRMEEGRVTQLTIDQAPTQPLRLEQSIRALPGRYVSFEDHDVEVDLERVVEDWSVFTRAIDPDYRKQVLRRLRFGGVPCWMQRKDTEVEGDFVGELPGAFAKLDSRTMYLFSLDGVAFQQVVEMT
jgi:hypothetical protein